MRVTAYLPVNSSRKAKDTTLRSPARFGDKGLLTSALCTGVTRPLAYTPHENIHLAEMHLPTELVSSI